MKDSNGFRIVITHVQLYRIVPTALFLHKKATRKNYNLLFLLVGRPRFELGTGGLKVAF